MDNLSTHTRKSLTDLCGEDLGCEVWDCFTPHYTPKHGSWLNQAEIEIGLFSRQCMGRRRIADLTTLRRETAAWNRRVNREQMTIDWKFDRKAARRKFACNEDFRFGRRGGSRVGDPPLRGNDFRAVLMKHPPCAGGAPGEGRPGGATWPRSARSADTAPSLPLDKDPLRLLRGSSPSTSRHRQRGKPRQHLAEQPAVEMPLGQQQPVVPRVLNQPPAGLHQAVLQACQRPALDPARQPQPPPQVAQVVGQHGELQPDLV